MCESKNPGRAVAVVEDQMAIIVGHCKRGKTGQRPESGDFVVLEIPFSHAAPAGEIDPMAVSGEYR